MKFKSKITSLLMAGTLVLTGITYVFTTEQNSNTNNNFLKTHEDISPFADKSDVSKTISQSNKNGDFKATYTYAKVHFQSTDSSSNQTVHVQDSKGNTLSGGMFTVGPNKSGHIFLTLKAGTNYKFNVTTAGGATNASGVLNVRTATTQAELK